MQRNRIKKFYPDSGPLCRAMYPKHMEFFRAGLDFPERCLMAANRVGKTITGAYEVSTHLTGKYPEWWPGRRFLNPVSAWACGDTGTTVRDITQFELLGPIESMGTGMIPYADIVGRPSRKSGGIPDAIDTVKVRHVSGGISRLSFKSYKEGRISFQGTAKDVIWLDEEPDQSIYSECLLRLMTRNGILLSTFTPLMGMSDVVLSFMPGGRVPDA